MQLSHLGWGRRHRPGHSSPISIRARIPTHHHVRHHARGRHHSVSVVTLRRHIMRGLIMGFVSHLHLRSHFSCIRFVVDESAIRLLFASLRPVEVFAGNSFVLLNLDVSHHRLGVHLTHMHHRHLRDHSVHRTVVSVVGIFGRFNWRRRTARCFVHLFHLLEIEF